MQDFIQHLFALRATAKDAADEACNQLVCKLRIASPDLGPAIAEAAHHQAYAHWWTIVTDHIEHGRMDGVTALVRAREAARRTLLETVIPRSGCPFTDAQSIAAIEAARHFYQDTNGLEIDPLPHTGPPATGPATPVPGPITPPIPGPAAPPPATGRAVPPTGTYPAIDPRRSM
jgi:hypothetical protein